MIENIFIVVNSWLSQSIWVALFAAFLWGIISVVISPCHLAGIPLISGYLMLRTDKVKSAFGLSTIFALGVLFSIIIIGSLTLLLGRLFGDVWIWGDLAVGLLLTVFGAYLLGILELKWALPQYKAKNVSIISVFLMGVVFGFGLGPCTFAYIAPVIGFTFKLSISELNRAIVLLLFFAVGHTFAVALAGISGNIIQKLLKICEKTNSIYFIQKLIGIILIVTGMIFFISSYKKVFF